MSLKQSFYPVKNTLHIQHDLLATFLTIPSDDYVLSMKL